MTDLLAPAVPGRDEAIKLGLLVDTSAVAAFSGFLFPAGLTVAAWEEVVGTQDVAMTRAEFATGIERLQGCWKMAAQAVQAHHARQRSQGGWGTSRVRFQCVGARGRVVNLALNFQPDASTKAPVLTIHFEGE